MIRHAADGTARSIEHTLGWSNLVLFFSLPFKPAGNRNLFLNGHIALGVEGTIYQVYDPKALKTDFLFSQMPARDWLFGDGGNWVDRDPSSPRFKHVYLYGKCESKRTVVYYAGLQVRLSTLSAVKTKIFEDENRFRSGRFGFNILSNNCSSIIAGALSRAILVEESALNCVPVCLFRSFVSRCAQDYDVHVGKLAMHDQSAFELHRYCIGAGMQPEKAVDRWVAAEADPHRAPRTYWPSRSTTVKAER